MAHGPVLSISGRPRETDLDLIANSSEFIKEWFQLRTTSIEYWRTELKLN